MIVMRATVPIDPDRMDEAAELARDLAEASRAEDGVIDYQIAEDLESGSSLRFFECYEDQDAFETHTESDHFESFMVDLVDLLGGEPELVRYDVTDSRPVDL